MKTSEKEMVNLKWESIRNGAKLSFILKQYEAILAK